MLFLPIKKTMKPEEFRRHAHQVVDWIADYMTQVEQYPVMPQVQPYDLYKQLPTHAPQTGENFEAIFADFQALIVPNMTHWQHPLFCAYFPANSSPPSVLAEMLTSSLAAQCMVWQTSPAAAELEEMMMNWLKNLCGLPENWHGVIQDTASTATLCAILTAREKATNFAINENGFDTQPNFTVYCSAETHSSVEKALKIIGLGKKALQKVPTDDKFAINTHELATMIEADIKQGKKPLCVIANIGTTSSCAVDDVVEIGKICQENNIWLHIDAAYGGSVAILPEKRYLFAGLELADSYVFNPHKWLLTNFDCTAYYVKDKTSLIRTFEIMPEYLKTGIDNQVNNYRDWGIQLGRRFRALKLWFVLRSYGIEGIQKIIANHLLLTQNFLAQLQAYKENGEFEILAPVDLNLICFRYKPTAITEETELEIFNQNLLAKLNKTGIAFLTHTKLKGKYAIRLVIGQTTVEQRHLDTLWALLLKMVGETQVKIK
jgi:aromatic-L-amino-acid decarboxylase